MDNRRILNLIYESITKKAEKLYLSEYGLTSLPVEIKLLSNLKMLDLCNNKFMTIPDGVELLANLETLYMISNSVSQIGVDFCRSSGVNYLDLSHNKLVELPSSINLMKNLAHLYLFHNKLESLPAAIGDMAQLETLDLRSNALTSLPNELGALVNLTKLDLEDNKLTSPPPEIIANGTQAVLQYLRGLSERGTQQWVSKMLVVGQGGVGKTNLLRSLRGDDFQETVTTHGIEIGRLDVQHPTEEHVTMHLNTWDFAGQEIAHATHQFFLSNRSLFILAWNARHGFEQGRLYYWLETIKALAPNSPILIVSTWIDERAPDLPLTELRRSYPNILGHHPVSNRTGEGISELKDSIRRAAARLPLMGELWPDQWVKATEKVRQMPEKHISLRDLRSRLTDIGIKLKDVDILIQWLHDLGDILHFRENVELNDIVILKPQWVTQYIARILESPDVIHQNGVFTRQEMERLWHDLDGTMQERFLQLMEQFDLSYRTEENREISLVVERLPLDEADYHEKWEAILNRNPCHEISMKFTLSTIPAGVPTWFIARQHRFSTHTHWRNGVLFASDEDETHLALIQAIPHERFLRIAVRGACPPNFFSLLKDGMETTFKRFPGLEIIRTVPCPCRKKIACRHEFNYEDLIARINKKPTIECPKSGEDVEIAEMLYAVMWSANDMIANKLEKLTEAVQNGDDEIIQRIDNQTALIQREFLKQFEREQSLIESNCPNVFVLRKKKTGLVKKIVADQHLELELMCQYPGDWHPCDQPAVYSIDDAAQWLKTMAPYVVKLIKALKLAAPFASPLLGMAFSKSDIEDFESNVKLMEELVKSLPDIEKEGDDSKLSHDIGIGADKRRVEGADLRVLRTLLDKKDPNHVWGGLQKVLTPEGHYLWLCEHHRKEFKR